MKRLLPLIVAVALLVTCAFVGCSATAQAHRTVSQDTAEQRTYNHFNHLCGTVAWGWTWCWRRVVDLSSAPLGDHSWQVRYTWNEAKIGTLYACGIIVQYYTHTGTWTYMQGPSCVA
jgi:hypothetical protein